MTARSASRIWGSAVRKTGRDGSPTSSLVIGKILTRLLRKKSTTKSRRSAQSTTSQRIVDISANTWLSSPLVAQHHYQLTLPSKPTQTGCLSNHEDSMHARPASGHRDKTDHRSPGHHMRTGGDLPIPPKTPATIWTTVLLQEETVRAAIWLRIHPAQREVLPTVPIPRPHLTPRPAVSLAHHQARPVTSRQPLPPLRQLHEDRPALSLTHLLPPPTWTKIAPTLSAHMPIFKPEHFISYRLNPNYATWLSTPPQRRASTPSVPTCSFLSCLLLVRTVL